ncbi:MAG: HNH endonuclease [Chloroflexota bacterium]
MPRRLNKTTRAWVYQFLVLRDGEACQTCHGEPPLVPLDIDHINGDPTDWDATNLQFLCRSCNTSKENKARARLSRIPAAPTFDDIQRPGVGTRERERTLDSPTTRIIKEAVDYQAGSAEMRANYHFEEPYRMWVTAVVRERSHLLKDEAINAGAELVGCNPTTAKKYLAKLTSSTGPLQEGSDMLRNTVIIPREWAPGAGAGAARAKVPSARETSQRL